ncbi:Heme/hemopexin-binding protein [Pandoraea anapnoica]|uniref:Heme/hemopexin-binding protein n=1 Tax=Pandoraea anapnoica TaxID=2508301 RepID=A0A5E5A1R4_9BURK|nr:filamentous haemagglutinin family protein [Pandoraea anapnoica]VVE66997.1 Heme/hemopexin-binding protein [Pandoraea anapnoica]
MQPNPLLSLAPPASDASANPSDDAPRKRHRLGRVIRTLHRKPLVQAAALTLLASSAAHAQQAFSSAWFAARGAAQATASQTGRLPNGMPVTTLMDPSAQQQQANAQLQRSIANLSSAAQNIAAMQATQANARAAAANTDATIPDGLTEGGLKVDTNSLTKGWINANAPTQSASNSKTNVNVQQTADKAILNWETFNVGRNTSVNFAQQSDWSVLNRVNDPNARPSRIQGQIHGDGTVLILNRNGVIFGGTSQVDTRNLVAAAAKMTDAQFTTNGLYGANGTAPTFTDALGKVEVQAGANIVTRTPTSVTQGGGYVMLVGREVSNAGTIVTPQGQVALAAGDSFVIRKGVGTDANTPSTTRGNEIAPQLVAQSVAGKVVNTGLLMVPEGDITLAGRDVQQLGTAVSTTTVNTRGTIHLLNSASDTLGKVTLGNGALTSVLISDNGATALDSQRSALMQDSVAQDVLRAGASSGLFDNLSKLSDRRDQSRVEIVSGGNVEFQGNSLTLATGGQLAVSAIGRSFVANGAQLDVSGAVGVSLSMDSNNVKVNVQGNEQRDAPGNRDNAALNNANVYIDRRRLVYVPASVGGYANERWYTPGGLLEVGGYLANQAHGIGEWTAQGGMITLGGNEVVTQMGAAINLSGGTYNVQTGYLNQSWLRGADGQLYNVNTAPTNVLYTGVYNGFEVTHPRWGTSATESYASPLIAPTRVLQNGYTVGRDAGRLSISAPTAVLEGEVIANVYTGPVQTQARPGALTDGYALSQFAVARAGSLTLGQYAGPGRTGAFTTDVEIGAFDDITSRMGVADALDASRANTLWLDVSRLNRTGFGELDLVSAGNIAVKRDLTLDNGGRLSLVAPDVDVSGTITVPSGTVTIANMYLRATDTYPIALLKSDGTASLTLEPGAKIDVRGLWVNGSTDSDSLSKTAFLNGGNVTFDSTRDVTISEGSTIDVSSGGAVLANGKTKGGTGGNVTLIAGDSASNVNISAGTLILNGDIVAYGVNGGGKLTVSTPDAIMIGSNAELAGGLLAAGTTSNVAVKLAEPYTVPAGTPLPFSTVDAHTKLIMDVPLPVNISVATGPTQPTAAPWVVPTGTQVLAYKTDGSIGYAYFNPGDTVPQGTRVFTVTGYNNNNGIPAGTVIPSRVFPQGFAIQPYRVVYSAGTVNSVDVTYPTGSVVPAGTKFSRDVAVAPVPMFNAGDSGSNTPLFAAGFGNYDITGGQGVRVDTGVVLAPVMPVYRFGTNSFTARTGADPASAMEVVLPPLFAENAQTGTLAQRAGASIALRSIAKDYQGNKTGGDVSIGRGASVVVDPGQNITLDSFGQITVDGSLTARGGKITLTSEADNVLPSARNFDVGGKNLGMSTWLGPTASLDVSGFGYTAIDASGRTYGKVSDAGSITLNGGPSFVIVRPGAELNADGAAVTVDTATVSGQPSNAVGRTTLASNGGAISLSTTSGLMLDGNAHAFAGGAGALGGDLSLSLVSAQFQDPAGKIPGNVLPPSQFTVTQARGTPVVLAGPADVSSLTFGLAAVSADQIREGGFASATLASTDYLMFRGDVSLALDKSLRLTANAITSGRPMVGTQTPTINTVRLSAPYVSFSATPAVYRDGYRSGAIGNTSANSVPTNATFEVDANLIDIQGPISFGASTAYYDTATNQFVGTPSQGFKTTRFVSQGDIRFLPTTELQAGTSIMSGWDMDFVGAQIYPTTGAMANIIAGSGNPNYDATLTLGRSTADVPDVPMSVFGTLYLAAPNIMQGGVLRAPFGVLIFGQAGAVPGQVPGVKRVELLPGSVTSVSTNGLTMPYGGTFDGVTYNYNGASIAALGAGGFTSGGWGISSGIRLEGESVAVDRGAVLDLSGGGSLTGAGFVTGRGGSVNVLTTPLVNANPTMTLSKAGNRVYAIVPGYASSYAPVSPENGGGDPAIGQRITLGAGVPGLPAGTYTLLPSNYALLPGAFRVEIGGTGQNLPATATAAGNGTYLTSGYTSIANTSGRSQLPSTVLVTSADAVRRYSQFNEQSYSDFLTTQAAQFGNIPPLLPRDGKALDIQFDTPSQVPTTPVFTFDGTARFQAAPGGVAGQAAVERIGEITTGNRTAGYTGVSVSADALSAIEAPRLSINGTAAVTLGQQYMIIGRGNSDLFLRDGVTLSAGEIYLVGANGTNITLGNNVTLTTIGKGPAPFDTATTGLPYTPFANTVLAVSNGDIEFAGPQTSNGTITIGAGSGLFSEGTVVFSTNGASQLDPTARFGARNISLAVGSLNVGDAAQIATAGNPAGMMFNQTMLSTLMQGDPTSGAPALEKLTLGAANAINVFGSRNLDTRGSGVEVVLKTPAIYGYGGSADHATVAADRLTWNGVAGASAPAIAAGGPGTGSGTLSLVAREIDLGQFSSTDTTNVTRTIYGFGNVDLTASERIVSAGRSTLFVYQAPSTQSGAVFGQSGTGGNLTLATPLLSATQKSVTGYVAGGALNVVAPAGTAPSAATSTIAGAEIDLTGDSVRLGSTVLLPSGKLAVDATNDIVLADGSRIDLSGQKSAVQDATVYGFGGTLLLTSAQGNVTQSAGSVMDVSAQNNNAGDIVIDAGNGTVALNGQLRGAANTGYLSGDFGASAGSFADFAGLNASLTTGGFFDARSFVQKHGDLNVGNGVKAHNVNISVDGGSLTVDGTIDASGSASGTIRLSAANGLTLSGTSLLDAHSTKLQVDSYGAPIEAKNRGHIELTTASGTMTLSPGATLDLSTPGGTNYGEVILNAVRTSETSGDIAINASGPLNIRGANSVALNGFWTYNLPAGSGISQGTLDGYDAASTSFINAAAANSFLATRTAGLSALGSAYHLRPGVQIASVGDLSTIGDIDLAKFRYGPNANRDPNSASYGAGEPMALVVRAGGNLTIGGSISDGFRASAGAPAQFSLIDVTTAPYFKKQTNVVGGATFTYWFDENNDLYLANAWTVPNDAFYNWWTINWWGPYVDTQGNSYNPGDTIPAGTTLSASNSYGFGFEAGNMPAFSALTSPAVAPSPATSPGAAMLAAGSLSTSLRLVGGADLASADQRAMRTTRALAGQGNVTLSDASYNNGQRATTFSLLRTGTGNLDILAAGSFSEATPFGVYTAGTTSAPILAANGTDPYNLPNTASAGGVNVWYPEHGGDVLISAQQDVTGNIQMNDNSSRYVDSNITSNWLWRQGGAGLTTDPTAWGINFGAMVKVNPYNVTPGIVGFQGIGTLGGGNLTLIAGRNAGVMASDNVLKSTGLDLAVASTGRVLADGTVVQTGGGDLTVKVGGMLNGRASVVAADRPGDYFGSVTALRGDTTIDAGSIGATAPYGNGAYWKSYDPRAQPITTIKGVTVTRGPMVVPGDGVVSVSARGDLVLGGVGDAGMTLGTDVDGSYYTSATGTVSKGGNTRFTLYRPETGIRLFTAGGDVVPLDGGVGSDGSTSTNGTSYLPGSLSVVAANGDIRFNTALTPSDPRGNIELISSPVGQLDMLAAGSIYGQGATVAMSGADMSSLATPRHPFFQALKVSNLNSASVDAAILRTSNNPLAYGEDTVTSLLHAQDSVAARVYAGIDIDDLSLGLTIPKLINDPVAGFIPTHSTWYIAAKPFEVMAGRDIVGVGATPNTFLNPTGSDISRMQAGRDILFQSANIVGPGLLQMQAGRNLYQGYYGMLTSVGDVIHPSNTAGGADISVLAGVGANGPDYASFAKLYFDPANQLFTGATLAGSGKVAHAYGDELVKWLADRFGYTGTASDALAYFLALPSPQQGAFVRQVYFKELLAGGREYNDVGSPRYGSYLRGRDAIATLFPSLNAQGQPIDYTGAITMFSSVTGMNNVGGVNIPITADAGVRTNFGGSIQMLNPGGRTLVGVEGVTPGATAGVVTQGEGDIALYSRDSILLGLSRIMTTFGGSIQAWSAQGDINAGRGSKTTVLYTPPKRVYDNVGDVTLSPAAPSNGAGIATLAPLPEVPPGDVDLVAPLGTIDAGEAGVRVSGNVNFAALAVVNAANVQVQGKSTGLPVIAAVNVGALTNASATASQAANAAQDAMARERVSQRQNAPSIFSVRMLSAGDGSGPSADQKGGAAGGATAAKIGYDPSSAFQLVGNGELTEAQKMQLTREEKAHL